MTTEQKHRWPRKVWRRPINTASFRAAARLAQAHGMSLDFANRVEVQQKFGRFWITHMQTRVCVMRADNLVQIFNFLHRLIDAPQSKETP